MILFAWYHNVLKDPEPLIQKPSKMHFRAKLSQLMTPYFLCGCQCLFKLPLIWMLPRNNPSCPWNLDSLAMRAWKNGTGKSAKLKNKKKMFSCTVCHSAGA